MYPYLGLYSIVLYVSYLGLYVSLFGVVCIPICSCIVLICFSRGTYSGLYIDLLPGFHDSSLNPCFLYIYSLFMCLHCNAQEWCRCPAGVWPVSGVVQVPRGCLTSIRSGAGTQRVPDQYHEWCRYPAGAWPVSGVVQVPSGCLTSILSGAEIDSVFTGCIIRRLSACPACVQSEKKPLRYSSHGW